MFPILALKLNIETSFIWTCYLCCISFQVLINIIYFFSIKVLKFTTKVGALFF